VVSLARHSAAGEAIDRLGHLGAEVIARLRSPATKLEPAPKTPLVFGSFARGEADANSDLDVLAVRSPAADPDKWAAALSVFAEQAHEPAGNRVQVLDYDLDDLHRKAGPKAKVGRDFWHALRRDASSYSAWFGTIAAYARTFGDGGSSHSASPTVIKMS